MRKQTLYPKTTRVGKVSTQVVITEKLDGSNLCFFKHDGELYVAQRNWIFSLQEILTDSTLGLYKGLRGWLIEHGAELLEELHDGAAVCGEWIGMGKLSYGDTLGAKFVQFAKGNVKDSEYNLVNIYYDHELFKWSYKGQEIPKYLGVVPIVCSRSIPPTKEDLDVIYQGYSEAVSRDCEGFIVNTNNTITKYVRMKNGKLSEHKS